MKIVFTSCMDAERVPDQAVWQRIADNEQPDVLMLLGDQIYMDWGLGAGATDWRALIAQRPDKGLEAFATEMHRRYALQYGKGAPYRHGVPDRVQAVSRRLFEQFRCPPEDWDVEPRGVQ